MLDRKKDHSTRPMGIIAGCPHCRILAVTGIAVASHQAGLSFAADFHDLCTLTAILSGPIAASSWSDREPRPRDELLYAAWKGDMANRPSRLPRRWRRS